MAYGIIKVDTIIFDQGGADQNVTVSGIYRAITSGVTVSGTISGAVLVGTTTVSGTTVTGTTANFVSGVFTTVVSGATVTGNQSSFTSGNFVTLSGATATFTSGVIASGTVTNPSLSIVGDGNTGIYSPGADQLAVATNGTGRLVIDANGTVTCTSAQPTDGSIRISNTTTRAPSNKYGIRFADSASETNAAIYAEQASSGNNASALVFGTNNGTGGGVLTSATERLRITAAGLVGIGTSSPVTALQVVGTATFGNGVGGRLQATTDSSLGYIDSLNNTSTEWQPLIQRGTEIQFHTNTAGVTPVEKVRITSAGLVGIGTSSPGNLLHVESSFSGTLVKIKNNAGSTSADTALEIESSTTAAKTFLIKNSGTERFYVKGDGTSYFNGLVGIGTTSPGSALDVAGEIRIYPASGDANLRFGSGGVEKGRIAVNSSSNCIIETAGTERARIDSSGRLLVGTSTSVSNLLEGALQIVGTSVDSYITATRYSSGTDTPAGIVLGRSKSATKGTNTIVTSGDTLGAISFSGANGTSFDQAASIVAYVDGTPGASGDMPGRLVFSTTADGASSPTERVRINAAGAFKASTNGAYLSSSDATHEAVQSNSTALGLSIYTSSASYASTALGLSVNRNTTNNTYYFIEASVYGVAYRFQVADSGNVTNANNSYGGISDRKFKENIVDAASQWNDIKALQVCKYNFKEETGQPTHTQIGLIAQEVELISPGLVNESPDRDEDGNDLGTVTKSVNYSVLYMKAVKALQEAMTRIETLEADVALLKSA